MSLKLQVRLGSLSTTLGLTASLGLTVLSRFDTMIGLRFDIGLTFALSNRLRSLILALLNGIIVPLDYSGLLAVRDCLSY